MGTEKLFENFGGELRYKDFLGQICHLCSIWKYYLITFLETLIPIIADTVQLSFGRNSQPDAVGDLSNALSQYVRSQKRSQAKLVEEVKPAAPVQPEENEEDFCNPDEEEKVLLKKVFGKKFAADKKRKLSNKK